MVRLSRPECAACAVQPGLPDVLADAAKAVAAVVAIIDVMRLYIFPRYAFSLLFSYSCPSMPPWTRLISVYPQCACAWVFALAIYSIQNQSADHLTS